MRINVNLRDPRIQKVILVTIALAGAGYYYFMSDAVPFGYSVRGKALAEKRENRDKLAKDVKKARAAATRLAALRKENDQLEAEWRRVEARLPVDLDARALMSEITSLGTRQSLQFLLLEPKGARSLDFCTEIPFSVRVLGSYHQLGYFLADLDNAPRILKLDGLRIVQNPKARDDKEEPPLIAEFDVSTYTLGGNAFGGGIPEPVGEAAPDAVGASTGPAQAGTAAKDDGTHRDGGSS